MLWKVWAAVGAVVCGILVAAAAGGSTSPWAFAILVAAVVAGAAVTAALAALEYVRNRHVEPASALEREFAPHQPKREIRRDAEIVQQLLGLIGERERGWLHDEGFAGPWREAHVAPIRELAQFDAGRSGIFDLRLGDAAGRLTDAARAFIAEYDLSTVTDPMVRDATWRMIGRYGPDGEVIVPVEDDPAGSRIRLRTAAAEICEGYDALSALSRETFPPDLSGHPAARGR